MNLTTFSKMELVLLQSIAQTDGFNLEENATSLAQPELIQVARVAQWSALQTPISGIPSAMQHAQQMSTPITHALICAQAIINKMESGVPMIYDQNNQTFIIKYIHNLSIR